MSEKKSLIAHFNIMKITFVATFPNPNLTNSLKGGYRRVTELIKLFSYKNKNQINLFVISKTKYSLKSEYCNNIHFVCSRTILFKMVKTFFSLLQDRKWSDIIILYNPTYLTFPALFLKPFGVKLIIDYVDLQGTIVEGRKKWLRKFIEKIMIMNCNYFIISSSFLQEKILLLNPNSKIFMHRGVFNLTKSLPTPNKKEEGIINIMYLGNLSPISGVDLLIKAYDSLKYKNTHLYIVGQGSMKKRLIQLSRTLNNPSITFKLLSDSELHPFMLSMDILTIPYIEDKRNQANFPSKIIEYLWCGKAILATNVGEIPKVLENDRNALLVEEKDLDAIKSGLSVLINNKELRERLGKNAKQYFEENFTYPARWKKINDFLELVKRD
jgi:glycosyltransferase involved in cell wall biosynthesis